jgi:polysaccharide export outer membrane protein
MVMNIRTLLAKSMIGLCLALMAPVAGVAQPAPSATAPAPAPGDQNYIIGPGDVVQVDLRERTDFSTKAKVGTDGMIQLPYIGNITAANRTSQQLSDQISAALIKGGFFEHPILAVEVVSYASRYVTVLGAVQTPGLIPIDRAYHLSEVIARVGGIRDGGADYVILRPAKGPERHYVVKALATGDPSDDPYVSPGDTVFAPPAELFYISGQVKAPGAYPMISDMTLRMAIGRGGGLTDLGSDHGVKITRQGEKVKKADLDSKIEPGDVIVVGERLF